VKTERDVLEKAGGSPFFVRLHYAFQSDTHLHLVMDYKKDGDLFNLLQRLNKLSENDGEVLLGGDNPGYGIPARDERHLPCLKPENILLVSKGHIAMADYGLCKQFATDVRDKRSHSVEPQVMCHLK
jgi:serine/threonine protein kinase